MNNAFEGLDRIITAVLNDVMELPDRTSPDDWPEAMLVTGQELSDILTERFATHTPSRREAVAPVPDLTAVREAPYRVGRKVPRNVYRGDTPVFMAASDSEAVWLVALLNEEEAALARIEGQADRPAGGIDPLSCRHATPEEVAADKTLIRADRPAGEREGWVLMPVELTDEMRDAAVKGSRADVSYADVEELWPALIKARPTPTAATSGEQEG